MTFWHDQNERRAMTRLTCGFAAGLVGIDAPTAKEGRAQR